MARNCAEAWHRKYGIGSGVFETLAAHRSDWFIPLDVSAKQATEFVTRHGQPGQTFSQAVLGTAKQIAAQRRKGVAYLPKGGKTRVRLGRSQHDVLLFFEPD